MATLGHCHGQENPQKLMTGQEKKLIRDAPKRPTATLKKLVEFMADPDHSLHVTTILHILHMSGLWGTAKKQKPWFREKDHPDLSKEEKYMQSAKTIW